MFVSLPCMNARNDFGPRFTPASSFRELAENRASAERVLVPSTKCMLALITALWLGLSDVILVGNPMQYQNGKENCVA